MTCGAAPRAGITPGKSGADTAHSNAQGAFSIDAAPAGDIAVYCYGLWRIYSDGVRMITLQQTADVDLPVVAWSDDAHTLAGLDAMFDFQMLVPRLMQVRPGGVAATAGLQDGDVVIAVDGVSVTNLAVDGVEILIRNRAPGSKYIHCLHECNSNPHFGHCPAVVIPCNTVPHCVHRETACVPGR